MRSASWAPPTDGSSTASAYGENGVTLAGGPHITPLGGGPLPRAGGGQTPLCRPTPPMWATWMPLPPRSGQRFSPQCAS